MLRAGLFKTPKHRKFEYSSRYYNAHKEELERRKKTAGTTIHFDRRRHTGVGSNSWVRLILLIAMGATGVAILIMGVSIWSVLLLIALLGMVFKFSRRA